jgi:NAD(P)-dependent dehydrogenase (short-subunit alcohol dehydrogenase family)
VPASTYNAPIIASPRPLANKVAIVTGGALGIGAATARRLAADGAHVLLVDLDATAVTANTATIHTRGGSAQPITLDAGTDAGVRAMIDAAVERWGRLDIVVSNAYAESDRGDAVTLSEDQWDRSLDVGLKAMFRAAKYAVPHLRAVGGGVLINLSSVHGLLAAPARLLYETLKTAVIGLTRQLAVEYGPDGIRANAVCPGHIVTERLGAQWAAHPDGLQYFEQQYPLRRCGTPADIANAIAFLCSDDASFITGQALVVDGGLTIQLQEDLGVRLARFVQQHPDTWFPY